VQSATESAAVRLELLHCTRHSVRTARPPHPPCRRAGLRLSLLSPAYRL
jgi:hypothetical protein